MIDSVGSRRQACRIVAVMAATAMLSLAGVATAADAPMAMVVEFAIKDYAAWRPVFDGAGPERTKAGVVNARVYRNADQPDRILVVFDVRDRKHGTDWMSSADVKVAWQKGGVIGVPAYRFLQ